MSGKKKHDYRKQISNEIANLFQSLAYETQSQTCQKDTQNKNEKSKDIEERHKKGRRKRRKTYSISDKESKHSSEDLDKLVVPYFNEKCEKEHKYIDDDKHFIKCKRCGFLIMKN